MKERLYNTEGNHIGDGDKVSSEFDQLIYEFVQKKSKKYDLRDLENIMHSKIYNSILKIIAGF